MNSGKWVDCDRIFHQGYLLPYRSFRYFLQCSFEALPTENWGTCLFSLWIWVGLWRLCNETIWFLMLVHKRWYIFCARHWWTFVLVLGVVSYHMKGPTTMRLPSRRKLCHMERSYVNTLSNCPSLRVFPIHAPDQWLNKFTDE